MSVTLLQRQTPLPLRVGRVEDLLDELVAIQQVRLRRPIRRLRKRGPDRGLRVHQRQAGEGTNLARGAVHP